jgi:hypothetical protein
MKGSKPRGIKPTVVFAASMGKLRGGSEGINFCQHKFTLFGSCHTILKMCSVTMFFNAQKIPFKICRRVNDKSLHYILYAQYFFICMKLKNYYRFYVIAMLLFYILHGSNLNKSCTNMKINPNISGPYTEWH